MPGTLFVVATPIGNLEDLTFRALRTLREADAIAAEDTRRTSRLLAHYGVQKPLVSLHAHNESRETPGLVRRMLAGESIALVSDAGTPGISDPGQWLVAACREAGIAVSPIPGPSAVTAALSASGFQGTRFTFLGFPPASGQERQDWIASLHDDPGIIILFEAPHRFERTMAEVTSVSGIRPIIVAREISKIHETLALWPNAARFVDAEGSDRGEFVIVIGPESAGDETPMDVDAAEHIVRVLTENRDIDHDAAVRGAAAILEQPPRKLRNALKKARIARRHSEETAE